jgi:transposase
MSNKAAKGSRRKYDAAFKEDVLKMVESGRSIPEIAKSLGISETIIYRWKNRSKNAQNGLEDSSVPNSQAEEIQRLKAQLHRTEQERDILKKALGIFSRGI